MKSAILLLMALSNFFFIYGQGIGHQGFLKYNVVRNYYHGMPVGKKELYSSKSFSASLYYKNKEALYKEVSNEDISEETQEKRLSNNAITIVPANIDKTQSIVYKNYQQNMIYYSFSSLPGRLGNFLKDTIRSMIWESATEEKVISNRRCTKFILKSFFNTDWTAWIDLNVAFTEGPWRFHNLPGLIIELHADNGTQSYILQEISMGNKIANETLYPIELKTVKIFNKVEYEKMEKDKKERVRLLMEQNSSSRN